MRELLLKGAAQLFNCKGYAATTVREIVAAVGVTKPVLYYYFGSKEGIYLELMNGPFRKFDAVFRECREQKGTAADRLMDLFGRTLTLFTEHIETVRIMHSLYYGPPQGAPFIDFAAYYECYWETVRELIEEGRERGEFKKVDPDLAAWAVLGPLSVAVEACLSHHEHEVRVDELRRVVGIVLDGIRAVPSKGEAC